MQPLQKFFLRNQALSCKIIGDFIKVKICIVNVLHYFVTIKTIISKLERNVGIMKDIIIFGRGKYLKLKRDNICKQYNIVAILDNSVNGVIRDEEFKCDVYHPDNINTLPEVEIFCLSLHFIEMWKQLIKLGVASNRIRFGFEFEPYYYDYERILVENGELSVGDNEISYLCNGECYRFCDKEGFKSVIRNIMLMQSNELKSIKSFPTFPISRGFGGEYGTPVDRIYIERFLEQNKMDVYGTVMEIASDDYIKRFGEDRVTEKIILHVKGWGGPNVLKGNFETGEGLSENMIDSLICTQTLQYIYNLSEAAKNIYKIIRPGGVALITVPGIKSLSRYHDANWGEQWSFTKKSLFKMFADVFGTENVQVCSYGNIKITTAYLWGICAEELEIEDFEYNDDQFPFIITARVKKVK